MGSHASVQTVLSADDAQHQAALKRSESSIRKFGESAAKSVQKAAKTFLALGAAMGGAAALFTRLYGVQEAAEAKLEAVLRATGNAAGFSAAQLKQYAADLQKVTTYGDETTISAMAVLATFREIRGDQFKAATKAAMDMSAVLGSNLQGSILQIGKALNDPIKGVTALADAGVSFTAQQREQIKALQESGDLIGAQQIILEELKGEFKDTAEAMAKTFGGRLSQLKGRLSDVGEEIGKSLAPLIAKLIPLVDEIGNRVQAAIKVFTSWSDASKLTALKIGIVVAGLSAFTLIVAPVISSITSIIRGISAMTSALVTMHAFSGPAGWAILATGIALAAGAVYGVTKAYDALTDKLEEVKTAAAKVTEEVGRQTTAMRKHVAAEDDWAETMRKTVDANAPWNQKPIAAYSDDAVKRSQARLDELERDIAKVGRSERELGRMRIGEQLSAGEITFPDYRKALDLSDQLDAARTRQGVEEKIAALQTEAATARMSTEEKTLYLLKQQGATADQLAKARASLSALADVAADKAAPARGSTRFEGLEETYRRISSAAASGPADRTARASEATARATARTNELLGGLALELGKKIGECLKAPGAATGLAVLGV